MNRTGVPSSARTKLHSHAHAPLTGEQKTGNTDPGSEFEVTLLLRRRNELPDLHSERGIQPLHHRTHLTHEALTLKHGASSSDIEMVQRFADEHHLHVASADPHRRAVVLKGRTANFERAFDVKLIELQHTRGNYRATEGDVSVPQELGDIVRSVLGLNTRPCARRPGVHHPNTTKPFWTVREMAQAYRFPVGLEASGQKIALIELGGGYHEEDLHRFFQSINRPMPVIRCISIDGAKNSPVPKEQISQFLEVVEGKRKLSEIPENVLAGAQCTVEVTMDIELAAAFAPGAEILVYMAPSNEQGIYNAVSRAISDKHSLPAALSISWGEPETNVSRAYLHSIDEVLRDAAMLGVTVCASSGDEGAMNGATDGKPAVNFPASSPHALSCGGSSVDAVAGRHISETAWNCTLHGISGATGGGVSRKFELPVWQHKHSVPKNPAGDTGRGVPDVAGPADPHRGCAIIVGGEGCSSAGTSAVAPLWAALVACANSRLGVRAGFITPLLYQICAPGSADDATAKPFRDITKGDNGFYKAGPGWDACTGLGSPIVNLLLDALRK